ncbi:hypothetical protein SBADM41S_01162 [Streptomyces badius]
MRLPPRPSAYTAYASAGSRSGRPNSGCTAEVSVASRSGIARMTASGPAPRTSGWADRPPDRLLSGWPWPEPAPAAPPAPPGSRTG